MKIMILCAIYGIEVVKYLLGLRIVFYERAPKWAVLGMMGAICLLYLWLSKAAVGEKRMIVYIMAMLAVGIAMHGSIGNRIFRMATLFILLISIDEMITIPLEYWMKRMPDERAMIFESRFLESLWGLLVVLLLYGIAWIARRRNLHNLKGNLMLLLIASNGMAIAFTVAGLNVTKDYIGNSRLRMVVDITVSVAYICLCLLCWLLVYMKKANEKMGAMVSVEQELKNAQRAYYRSMLEKEEETRKFRHDVNNHMIYLKHLAEENEIEGLKKYLGRMSGQLDEIQTICYATGNEVLDMILSDKLSKLEDAIQIEVVGKFTRSLPMDEMELCTIFSNLIQNALDELARMKGEGHWIKVQIHSGNQFVRFLVQNEAQNRKEIMKNGLPKSEKRDKKNHGIGLSNVREVVEKYEGELELDSTQNMFSVGVILPIK